MLCLRLWPWRSQNRTTSLSSRSLDGGREGGREGGMEAEREGEREERRDGGREGNLKLQKEAF